MGRGRLRSKVRLLKLKGSRRPVAGPAGPEGRGLRLVLRADVQRPALPAGHWGARATRAPVRCPPSGRRVRARGGPP